MSIQTQVAIRSKKLGVLIRDARLAAHKSIYDCAASIGVNSGTWHAWEDGRISPSLPELEILAYSLHQPLEHFWGKVALTGEQAIGDKVDLKKLAGIRQRLVGAYLRQQRENSGISIKNFSEQTGVPASRLKAYELGERSIPLPVLEALMGLLGAQVETMFDRTGPVGQWMSQQKAIQEFLSLSPELQSFISKPINRPYLDLALKLSNMSTDKLRSVAEDLLEITF